MMRPAVALLFLVLILEGCSPSHEQTATTEREMTAPEAAYDAGARAKKKAEDIKKEQEKKAQEALDATDQ
jgi:hypothetical protein